jgi:hypothetical protein
MEYILGSLSALIVVFFANRMVRKKEKESKKLSVEFSQSYGWELLKKYIIEEDVINIKPESQSEKFIAKQYVRIVIVENEAYWISNNQLYVADYADGVVDQDSTREVDTFSMDKEDIKKTMSIVERLTEES